MLGIYLFKFWNFELAIPPNGKQTPNKDKYLMQDKNYLRKYTYIIYV